MIRMPTRALLTAAFAALAVSASAATAPPRASISSFDQLKAPLPYPYDELANADAQVAKARAAAKAHHKLLLIDLGANWCGDCRVLAGTVELPEIKAFVDKHYEVVEVDMGRFNHNLQVPARYGFTKRLIGVPTLLVVDPVTDKLLNRDDVFALSDASKMSPQALADWLARWPK